MSDQLPIDNDFEFEYSVTRKNTATGALEAATELASLIALVSLTKEGGPTPSAIDDDLSVSASERSGTAGSYYGVFDGDKLRTHLLAYVGRKVYVVFGDGTNILRNDEYVVSEFTGSER